jgi:hypothetical protein
MFALVRTLPALMSMHNADTAWRAAAWSTSRSTEPIPILRCLRLPLPRILANGIPQHQVLFVALFVLSFRFAWISFLPQDSAPIPGRL